MVKKKEPLIRKIQDEHGYPKVFIPKEFGVKLNMDVIIEKISENPFTWEIRIRPVTNEKKSA